MRILLNSICLLVTLFCVTSCTTNTESKTVESTPIEETKPVMEVTTFNINEDADPAIFATLDAQVENDFTSKQPGFIRRQCGLDDKGNYAVVVYWDSLAFATASMNKFMNDSSVANYAQMIDGASMKMARYTMEKSFDSASSEFWEIMSYDLVQGTDMADFETVNYMVETDFTGKRKGFLQRLVGANEEGKQVVIVYWDNKENSDASIAPFMDAPIAKEFMAKMDQATMTMGRYSMLQ